jgi:hypothetical protein
MQYSQGCRQKHIDYSGENRRRMHMSLLMTGSQHLLVLPSPELAAKNFTREHVTY